MKRSPLLTLSVSAVALLASVSWGAEKRGGPRLKLQDPDHTQVEAPAESAGEDDTDDDAPDEPSAPARREPPMKFKLRSAEKSVEPSPEPAVEEGSEDPEIIFKKIPDARQVRAEPVAPDQSPDGVSVRFGYPRIFAFAEYRPGFFTMDQILRGGTAAVSEFNYESYLPIAFQLGASLEVDPHWMFDASLSFSHFETEAKTLQFYLVDSTSVTIATATAMGYYCVRALPNKTLRVCPGMGVGIDSYPVFEFDSNAAIALHAYSNVVIRWALSASIPVIKNGEELTARVGYDLGLTHGGGTGITDSDHHSLWADVTFLSVPAGGRPFQAGLRLESRSTRFVDGVDHWNASALLYSLNLGVGL